MDMSLQNSPWPKDCPKRQNVNTVNKTLTSIMMIDKECHEISPFYNAFSNAACVGSHSNHISIILRYSAIDVVRIDLLMRIALKMHVNDDRLSKRKI